MSTVRCAVCHRVERWSEGEIEVVVPGGGRRAQRHAGLSAWEVLRRSRAGQLGPVVGVCATCGQPMIREAGDAPPLEVWVIETPAGPLRVGAHVSGPDGVLTEDDATRWLERQLAPRWTSGFVAHQAFGSVLLLFFVLPMLLWMVGAVYATFFMYVGLASM